MHNHEETSDKPKLRHRPLVFNVQKCQCHKRQKKAEKLFQVKRDKRDMKTIRCMMILFGISDQKENCYEGHYWDK